MALALLLAAAHVSSAFISWTLGPGSGSATGVGFRYDPLSLPGGSIPYWINPTRPANSTSIPRNTPDAEIIKHIQNAFQTWENVATTRVRFRYMGLTDVKAGVDGMNVVTFDPQGITSASGFRMLALLFIAYQAGVFTTSSGTTLLSRFPAQILDADIFINPHISAVFTVSDDGPGQIGRDADLQGNLVHEVGHLLGLGHTNAGNDGVMTMNTSPVTSFELRNLGTDDVIGVSALYPAPGFLESRGHISGTIRRADGRSVFGAQVVAMNAQTGVIVTTTMSGLSELNADGTPKRYSVGRGEYRLVGLPPGTYRLYAEPLDMSYRNPTGGVFATADGSRQTAEFDFDPAFLAGTVTVGAGEFIGAMDITVGARAANTPVLPIYNYVAAAAGQPYNRVALVRRGSNPVFWFPDGKNVNNSSGLLPGTRIEFSSPDVTITSHSSKAGSGTYLFLKIAPDAPLGPRLIQVTTSNGTAFWTGGLVVIGAPPVIRSITRESSATGTTAIIDGENFASASLPVVMFNGQVSTGLTVESDTRLRAGVPPGAENATDVRVITPAGVARG